MQTRVFLPLRGALALRILAALSLLCMLAACSPTNTLVDEAGTVSSGSYWSRGVKLSNSGPVSIDLNVVEGTVVCYLVDSANSPDIASGHFRFVQELSAPAGTQHFVQTATVPAGTYSFIVMTMDHASVVNPPTVANFAVIIKGGLGSSVTTGIAPPVARGPAPGQPSARPTSPTARPGQIPPPGYVPPPPLKLTFSSIDDAAEWLVRGQLEERQAALAYVEQQNVTADNKKAVFDAVMPLARDENYQHNAQQVLMKWASSEDLPTFRNILRSMIGANPAQIDTHDYADAVALTKFLLAAKDRETVPLAIHLMSAPQAHDDTHDALVAFGTGAEPAVLDALARKPDAATTKDLIELLADVGTDKSIQPLQDYMASRDQAISGTAGQAIAKLATRLNLTPDQYLFNLFNRYVIDGPTGFAPDTTVAASNTKRWTRQTPGRAVKSTYTVQVTKVPNGFQLQAPPNGSTLPAGALIFHSMNAPAAPQFTVGARMTALDGDYLIDVIAIVDSADLSVQNNITNAVKKIHPR